MESLKKVIFICLLSIFLVSCKDPYLTSLETNIHPQLFYDLKRGQIEIEKIGLTSNPSQTMYGDIIDVRIRNLTDKSLPIVIEPGTVLRSNDQKLFTNLVITSGYQQIIPPHETLTQTVEAFSINFHRYSPVADTQYSLGTMIGGDVGNFLECFSKRRPDKLDPTVLPDGVVQVPTREGEPPTYIVPPNVSSPDPSKKYTLMPVQLAIWQLSENMNQEQLLKSVASNPQLKGGQYSESVRLYNQMKPYVQKLLDDCELGKYKF